MAVQSKTGLTFDAFDLLSVEEKDLLAEVNHNPREYPADVTIPLLISRHSRSMPGNDAVIQYRRTFNYGELDDRANRLARLLMELGVVPNRPVAICADRGFEFIAGALGIMKAGGAYVPVDPGYPKERIRYILEDSACRVLITQSSTLEFLEPYMPGSVDTVICLDEGDGVTGVHREFYRNGDIQVREGGYLEPSCEPESPAYIIYTSGSTGKPKGVVLTHKAVLNTLFWLQEHFGLTPDDVIAQKTSVSFTDSVWEIVWPLMVGAKLTIVNEEDVKDPRRLFTRLEKDKVTVTQFVPALMKAFLASIDVGAVPGARGARETRVLLPDLKWVFNGGEAIPVSLVREWWDVFEHAKIANIYGMTESAIYASYHIVERKPGRGRVRIPIGRPIANTRMYVMGLDGQPCPVDTPGEICIGGVGLTVGYWKSPGLTEKAFTTHPDTGERLYKTGDLGFLDPGGNFQYIGRSDDQVQVRGNRVEIKEVEGAVLRRLNAAQAAVIVSTDDTGQNELVCFYTAADGEAEELQAIREKLEAVIPAYMIPSYFKRLETMPLTPHGKIDRKALSASFDKPSRHRDYVAPSNEGEREMAAIWAEVLAVDKPGIDDNFFELGGQSLKAMLLLSKIFSALNVTVSMSQLFDTPTIRSLAGHIAEAAVHRPTAVEAAEKKEYYPAAAAQHDLYRRWQEDPESTSSNMPRVFQLEGEVDPGKVEDAFRKLIKRHESLRTSFMSREGRVVQKVRRDVGFEIERYDMEEVFDDAVNNFVRPFDLSRPPLLRAALIKIDERKYLLLQDIHLIIFDAESRKIMEAEFPALYRGKEPAPLTFHFKDYSQWLESETKRESLRRQERYWLNVFETDSPVLVLPGARGTGDGEKVQSGAGDSMDFEIGDEDLRTLRDYALKENATLYMVLLAVFNVFLSKLCRREDIVVGTAAACRTHTGLHNIIGRLANTLALRNFPVPGKSFHEFFSDLRERTLDAFDNQEYRFKELVEKLSRNGRDFERYPLFNVKFTYHDITEPPAGLEEAPVHGVNGLRVLPREYYNRPPSMTHQLELQVGEAGEKVTFSFVYKTGIFDRETITGFIGYFLELVYSIAADTREKISRIGAPFTPSAV